MATIRRKNGKWQALIRRAGAPTCSKTFISKSDARKWAIRVEQAQDKALAGVIQASSEHASTGLFEPLQDRYIRL